MGTIFPSRGQIVCRLFDGPDHGECVCVHAHAMLISSGSARPGMLPNTYNAPQDSPHHKNDLIPNVGSIEVVKLLFVLFCFVMKEEIEVKGHESPACGDTAWKRQSGRKPRRLSAEARAGVHMGQGMGGTQPVPKRPSCAAAFRESSSSWLCRLLEEWP